MKKIISVFVTICMILMLLSTVQLNTIAAETWLWPAEGCHNISSGYGYRTYNNKEHGGIDIDGYGVSGGFSGRTIRAAKSGTVYAIFTECGHNYGKTQDKYCGCGDGYGNYVYLRHSDGTTSRYAHLGVVSVKNGQSVSRGDKLGTGGSTGNSGGHHLHFEIRDSDGNTVNPMPIDYTGRHTYYYSTAAFSENIRYAYDASDPTPGKPKLKNMRESYYTTDVITLTWDDTINTTQYYVFIYKSNNGVYEKYDTKLYVESGLQLRLAEGEYSIVLEAVNANAFLPNGNWYGNEAEPVYISVLDPTPGKPKLKNMRDSYYTTDTITLTWDDTINTTQYYVFIYKYNDGAYEAYDTKLYVESGFQMELPEGDYSIVLESVNANTFLPNGNWYGNEAEPVYISVLDPTPGKPKLKNMRDSYYTTDTITLTWDATTNTTQYYVFLYKYDGSEYVTYDTHFYVESGMQIVLPEGDYSIVLESVNANAFLPNGNWYGNEAEPVYIRVSQPNVTIRYYCDGMEISSEQQNKKHGESIELSMYVPIRKGYVFVGWTTEIGNMGNIYQPGDIYSEDVDLVLYAIWEKANPFVESQVSVSDEQFNVIPAAYNIEESYMIIVAGYKLGKLVDVTWGAHDVAVTLNGDIDEIKVMVWSDLDNVEPLCAAEVIPQSEWITE